MIQQYDTLQDTYIQNAQEVQFQKDLQTFKQAQSLKINFVKQKCQQIDQIYHRKLQQYKTNQKIKHSAFIQSQRMKIAQTKFMFCQKIFEQVLKRLNQIAQQQGPDYQLILINYMVEGCIQMFEENIKVYILENDLQIVKQLKSDILKSFEYFAQQQIGQKFYLNLIIVENDCLKKRNLNKQLNKNQQNQQAIGGVILSDSTGNIRFKNTFDVRLNILKESSFPLIRQMLWQNQ